MKNLLTDNELAFFSGQLAMILHSGISVLEGISILREDMQESDSGTAFAKEVLDTVYNSLEETGSLPDALTAGGVFPDYFIKMAEIGDRSGTLEDVMASLSDYYGRQDALMRSIRDALVYPLILLGMLFAVLIVLMTQVMPVFEKVFDQLGIEMTGISSFVFRISNVMQYVSIVLLILLAGAAVGCLAALRTQKGRGVLSRAVSLLPIGRTVSTLLACSRFADALSVSLHSGLDMGESFELASSLSTGPAFLEKTKKARALTDEGEELAAALRESGIITGMNARMVSIGVRTGTAETALKQISVSCQDEADSRIRSAVGMLEPIMTAVLSVLTGLILVSVMLPLLGVMANIG